MPKKLTPAQHYGLYGAQHRSLRKRLAPLVEAGLFNCPKCEFLPERPREPAFAFVPRGRRSRVW